MRHDLAFRRIARSLSTLELMRDEDDTAPISSADLVQKRDEGRRFLDFYGVEGLRHAFDRYGIFGALARRGFEDVRVRTEADDDRHLLFAEIELEGRTERLVELVVRRGMLVPHLDPGLPALAPRYRVLAVDWLLLRNPCASFSAARPRLPGQEHPGLGIGWRVMAMLTRAVWRLGLDALVTVPEHLHSAEHYAREMPCLDPAHRGHLEALLDLLRREHRLSTAQASWALEWGLVRSRADDSVVRWTGELMVAPEEPSLLAFLDSAEYRAELERVRRSRRFWIDRAIFDERWAAFEAEFEGETAR